MKVIGYLLTITHLYAFLNAQFIPKNMPFMGTFYPETMIDNIL